MDISLFNINEAEKKGNEYGHWHTTDCGVHRAKIALIRIAGPWVKAIENSRQSRLNGVDSGTK